MNLKSLGDLMSNEHQNALINIKTSYGLNENIDYESFERFFSVLNSNNYETIQNLFYDIILNDAIQAKFEPSLKYKQIFLKKLIDFLEKKSIILIDIEIDSRFFDLYLESINNSISKNDQYFSVYFSRENLDDQKPVVIEQYSSIIAHGTTGLHVWPACNHMINFLNKNSSILENKYGKKII
jgi:hypothetical protein